MAKTKKSAPAKYADKSAGQPELLPVFDMIKKLVSVYVRGNYVIKADKPSHYELYYDGPVEMSEKHYPEVSFASVLIQKGYVGFYFFPVCLNDLLKEILAPELVQMLKGETCFHIKKMDPVIQEQLKETLRIGYDYYQALGWK
jgi:hypothetical protein